MSEGSKSSPPANVEPVIAAVMGKSRLDIEEHRAR